MGETVEHVHAIKTLVFVQAREGSELWLGGF